MSKIETADIQQGQFDPSQKWYFYSLTVYNSQGQATRTNSGCVGVSKMLREDRIYRYVQDALEEYLGPPESSTVVFTALNRL